MAHYVIHGDVDTILLDQNIYDEDGRIQRNISRHLSRSYDVKNALEGTPDYDTLFFLTDYVYQNGALDKTILKDSKGHILEENQRRYENTRLMGIDTYLYLGDEKYLSEKSVYVHKSGLKEPDVYTTNRAGDTVDYVVTEFQNDLRVTKTVFPMELIDGIKYPVSDFMYYKDDKLIGTIRYDPIANSRRISVYTYDRYGNTKESKSYTEKFEGEDQER